MYKILLIEDDKSIATTVSYYLEAQGFKIDTENTVKTGMKALNNTEYDLMLLDINLPDGTGYDLYEKSKKIPTIFLTALDEEKDIVKGFDLGADDYITKPFHAGELLSRIKNVLKHNVKDKKIKIRDVEINYTLKKVFKNDIEVEMTALEYKVLVMLFENRGRIITREQILSVIWDSEENFVNDNTLTVYIKRIREKIEDNPNKPEIIKTVRGLGYKIDDLCSKKGNK